MGAAKLDKLIDILPRGLKLSKYYEDGNTVPLLMDEVFRVGVIVFDGGFQAQLYATPDLFLRFPVEPPCHIKASASIPPLSKLPSNLVELWWKTVLNTPVTLGLENEFHISTDRLFGVGLRFRGVFLCLSITSIESSPAKPVWKRIRDSRPNLRSSLIDEPSGAIRPRNQIGETSKATKIFLCSNGGWSSEQTCGIADIGADSWVRFVSYKGEEPRILAKFPKADYRSSYPFFLESVGRFLPYHQYLISPIPVRSLRFEDLINVCRDHFPKLESQSD